MATTTNYGWTTPDDTALVKDGAAAIRTLGSSVDTTTKNLNPETTLGDISYRSSTANVNTRLPLGTAGQVLKVNSGATAPEWATDASGMTNPMTTTGDTIYSSSGSTPARLAIGSTGNVLTVAGGVPTWAAPAGGGGLTLLDTITFNNTVTNYTVSLSGTYKNLLLVGSGLQTAGAGVTPLTFRFNNDSGSNYNMSGIRNNAGTIQSYVDTAYTDYQTGLTLALTGDTAARFGNFQLIIYNYQSTSLYKVINCQGGCQAGGSGYTGTNSGNWKNNTDAITSIQIIEPNSQNLKAGTVQIYGVN